MESYSDSDTSSESECGSDLELDNEPDDDEVDPVPNPIISIHWSMVRTIGQWNRCLDGSNRLSHT